MFGNNKSKESNVSNGAATSTHSSGINSLVQGTSVEGEITADSDIRIDGKIKGSLISKAKVIIGPTGVIDGKVVCVNAVIEGSFNGNLEVQEVLTVSETARVEGDVFAGKLKVNQGAHFNVSCTMGSKSNKSNSSSKPANLAKASAAV